VAFIGVEASPGWARKLRTGLPAARSRRSSSPANRVLASFDRAYAAPELYDRVAVRSSKSMPVRTLL
jgi:hypothetical protein